LQLRSLGYFSFESLDRLGEIDEKQNDRKAMMGVG